MARTRSKDSSASSAWERLIVSTAATSATRGGQVAYDACRAAVGDLDRLLSDGCLSDSSKHDFVALGCALAVAFTAQVKLRQPIEDAIGSICDLSPESMSEVAERAQAIWQRRGQMSGAESLFVWDLRKKEWRLSQDFKPHRPSDES